MYTSICPFFLEPVGYSPELLHAMQRRFCFEDNSGCARLLALDVVALEDVPDDLLPSDLDRLNTLPEEIRNRAAF